MFCSECGKEVVAQAKYCRACGAPQGERDPTKPPPLPLRTGSSAVAPVAPPAATRVPVYAHFGRRVVAFLIDVAILFGLSMVLGALVAIVAPNDPQASGWVPLGALLSFWLYKAGFESSSWQASLGKRALALKVTTAGGERIGFGRATARFVSQIFSYLFFGIGYLMAAFTPRRQALHDYIAGTLVTRRDATQAEIQALEPLPAGSGIVLAVVLCFVGVAGIGIVAAIAIPAYQDYTVRAQVAEGLNLADAYKTAVSAAFANRTGADSINNEPGGAINLPTDVGARYIASMRVTSGTVLITFGDQANRLLARRNLALWPVLTDGNGTIVWVCGLGTPPDGLPASEVAAARRLTDVPSRFLPTSCRT
jgi:uncharacterized RDD family membrane protein YckC/Tfp pilus assembly major pilin PilA